MLALLQVNFQRPPGHPLCSQATSYTHVSLSIWSTALIKLFLWERPSTAPHETKRKQPGSEAFLTYGPSTCQSSPHSLRHTHPNSRQARLRITCTLYFMRSNLSSYQTFRLERLPQLNPSESYHPSRLLLQDAFSELPVMSASCKSRAVFLCCAHGLNTC